MFTIKGKYTSALVMVDDLEASCISQINTFCNHPAFTNPIAIMPDAHTGKGACIGFSMRVTDKVIPAVCGVDLGCGVLGIQVDARVFSNWVTPQWADFDRECRQTIPTGMHTHPSPIVDVERNFPWEAAQKQFSFFKEQYHKETGINVPSVRYDMDYLKRLCQKIAVDIHKVTNSIGTLGGGNHWCPEVGKSKENGSFWITVHSGSRNFGLKIATYHQQRAMNRLAEQRKQTERKIREEILGQTENRKERQRLIDEAKRDSGTNVGIALKDLEWLEGGSAVEYLTDMIFAQTYASFNRKVMMDLVVGAVNTIHTNALPVGDWAQTIESVHNYIDFDDFIIRKGAIRSYKGERSIIPFNMRDGMLICEGKSNPEANCTAPHGAGRLMSRSAAKQKLSLEEFEQQMEGIFSTSVCKSTLDEAPNAYKDAELIELAIEPTCTVIEHVKPVYNMKDKSNDLSWKDKRVQAKKDRRAEHKAKRETGRAAMNKE